MRSLKQNPYVLNFSRSQNCDAMIRHLMGDEREAQDCCTRCAQKKGALIGCIVAEGSTICGNCDWNRSGLGCSLASHSESRMYLYLGLISLLTISSQTIYEAQSG
jgi:hypothetical protein